MQREQQPRAPNPLLQRGSLPLPSAPRGSPQPPGDVLTRKVSLGAAAGTAAEREPLRPPPEALAPPKRWEGKAPGARSAQQPGAPLCIKLFKKKNLLAGNYTQARTLQFYYGYKALRNYNL